MTRSAFALVLSAALLAASTGCQREPTFEYAPVSGKVTKNGVPLSGVRIVFYADHEAGTLGPRAFGRTNGAGEYRLHTDAGTEGAVLGKHRVCIMESTDIKAFVKQRFEKDPGKLEKLAGKAPAVVAEAPPPPGWLPADYGSAGRTPLRAEVHAGEQTIDFVIP